MLKWICIINLMSVLIAKDKWYDGNLKGIDEISIAMNLKGVENELWKNKILTFVELGFSEADLRLNKDAPMPKLIVDIYIVQSEENPTSSYMISLSIYNYTVSESEYFKSMADSTITKKFMTNRIYEEDVVGQTSSETIYIKMEKVIIALIQQFMNQWYSDNPLSQF